METLQSQKASVLQQFYDMDGESDCSSGEEVLSQKSCDEWDGHRPTRNESSSKPEERVFFEIGDQVINPLASRKNAERTMRQAYNKPMVSKLYDRSAKSLSGSQPATFEGSGVINAAVRFLTESYDAEQSTEGARLLCQRREETMSLFMASLTPFGRAVIRAISTSSLPSLVLDHEDNVSTILDTEGASAGTYIRIGLSLVPASEPSTHATFVYIGETLHLARRQFQHASYGHPLCLPCAERTSNAHYREAKKAALVLTFALNRVSRDLNAEATSKFLGVFEAIWVAVLGTYDTQMEYVERRASYKLPNLGLVGANATSCLNQKRKKVERMALNPTLEPFLWTIQASQIRLDAARTALQVLETLALQQTLQAREKDDWETSKTEVLRLESRLTAQIAAYRAEKGRLLRDGTFTACASVGTFGKRKVLQIINLWWRVIDHDLLEALASTNSSTSLGNGDVAFRIKLVESGESPPNHDLWFKAPERIRTFWQGVQIVCGPDWSLALLHSAALRKETETKFMQNIRLMLPASSVQHRQARLDALGPRYVGSGSQIAKKLLNGELPGFLERRARSPDSGQLDLAFTYLSSKPQVGRLHDFNRLNKGIEAGTTIYLGIDRDMPNCGHLHFPGLDEALQQRARGVRLRRYTPDFGWRAVRHCFRRNMGSVLLCALAEAAQLVDARPIAFGEETIDYASFGYVVADAPPTGQDEPDCLDRQIVTLRKSNTAPVQLTVPRKPSKSTTIHVGPGTTLLYLLYGDRENYSKVVLEIEFDIWSCDVSKFALWVRPIEHRLSSKWIRTPIPRPTAKLVQFKRECGQT